MAALPEPLQKLIASLARLPGIGPRSAERIGLHLVQSETAFVEALADALLTARKTVSFCNLCGALTERQPCNICSDIRRDGSTLCVVERAVDVLSLDKSGTYSGKYHVLGGRISPLNGIGPEDLRIEELLHRLGKESVQEVIIALPADVEGDATSHYLAKLLKPRGVRISRIAQGLPAGAGLEHADQLTLSRALEGRRDFAAE
ncbi:MAG: recombination mediator RecR [Verrucomicrobiota bacterium]|nr:recombination mediator RecR [Verrucomicrobiota bacterium]